jgi:adenosylcobinamide-phosphate synthase
MIAFESMLVGIAGGIYLDTVLGDPSNKFHPVAWLGHLIGHFVPKLKQNSLNINSNNHINNTHSYNRKERWRSIIFSVLLILSFAIGIHFCTMAIVDMLGYIALSIFCAITLKTSIAINGMEKHAAAVLCALEKGDLTNARFSLSMIVKRDTKNLDEQHIISGTIESISENIVDGITSPLFYYSFIGPAGAFSFRIINTLDSMLGYRDKYYRDIGWMPAQLDTVANYIPSRITALIIVIAARMVQADWKKSIQILRRDHSKTSSRNAGYTMAAMAGALRVNLEKIGHYSIGDQYENISIEKCKLAISIMRYTVIAFAMIVCTPLITLLYLFGWWRMVFGV